VADGSTVDNGTETEEWIIKRDGGSLDWIADRRTLIRFIEFGSIRFQQCLWRREGYGEEECVALTPEAFDGAAIPWGAGRKLGRRMRCFAASWPGGYVSRGCEKPRCEDAQGPRRMTQCSITALAETGRAAAIGYGIDQSAWSPTPTVRDGGLADGLSCGTGREALRTGHGLTRGLRASTQIVLVNLGEPACLSIRAEQRAHAFPEPGPAASAANCKAQPPPSSLPPPPGL